MEGEQCDECQRRWEWRQNNGVNVEGDGSGGGKMGRMQERLGTEFRVEAE